MDKHAIKNNKWFRWAVWAAAGVAVLWGLGWLAVPPLVKSQAEKLASEQLGRRVSIGAVDFKPWTLELTLSDLTVATADGASAQLQVRRFYLDGELQSLLRLAPVVDAVVVEALHLKLTHLGAGRYDIDDILARLSRPSDSPGSEPPKFALHNLALSEGSVDFTDQSVSKTHELRDLRLTLPFLSNLDSKRELLVEPRLAFELNGSRFDTAAQGTPFAQTRKADATIRFAGLDLAPYLAYLPAGLPVQLQTAVLNADLQLAFEQRPRMAVKLSGLVEARGVKLADARSRELLAFDSLRLALDELRPLERLVRLASVDLAAPRLSALRDKGGRLNLALASTAPDATKTIAGNAPTTGATNPKDPETSPWTVAVAKLAVRGGVLAWRDEATAPTAQLALRDLALDAAAIALPLAQPLQFSGVAAIDSQPEAASLSFSGQATDRLATVTATLSALPLNVVAPYLAQFIEPTLGGRLGAELGLVWKASGGNGQAPGGSAGEWVVSAKQLTLDNLALTQGQAALASIKKLELAQAQLDLSRQSVSLGQLTVTQPRARVERGEDQRWMFERWLKKPPSNSPSASAAAPAAAADATRPWAIAIGDLALDAGAVSYLDKVGPKPVAFELSELRLQLKNFASDGKRPAPLALSARLGAGRAEPGRLDYRGTLALGPLATQGQLQAVHLPLHAFEPYFADALNIELLRADASFKGQLSYADSKAGPRLQVSGDTALEELRANSAQPGAGSLQLSEELLSWKALSLRGLKFALAPGAATTVDVKETTLSDFFARVIVHDNGRINLQDLVKSSVPAGTASMAPAAASSLIAAAQDPVRATAPKGAQTGAAGPTPVINVGPVSLVNGRVFFSDRFVKPNYSASLSELTGKLGAFSSQSTQGSAQLADLELRGRAEGTASLEILGKLNPLAQPAALDIKGRVRDLELSPLSPYSVKYAGHGIERGKLSMDVAYEVLPDGRLTASNQLVLNQLSFGDKVDGAPNSLPVRLAVALLADRNGVIDINLPVSGSLNDPQFSLGPVIFKAIVNLIAKAVSSPFSLLASALGGGDELSIVGFAPGSAVLSAEARQGLDKVAKALVERPALKMTVVGTASLEAERAGFTRERLKQLVQAEKRREAVLAGPTASAVVTVSETEYPVLLKEVYRRADMPKPRNLIGLAKDLPPVEMEALLLAHIAVSE
ncbi:MAG: DUF748 domain-containing protein, partial [Burkholderiaceae bacterium]